MIASAEMASAKIRVGESPDLLWTLRSKDGALGRDGRSVDRADGAENSRCANYHEVIDAPPSPGGRGPCIVVTQKYSRRIWQVHTACIRRSRDTAEPTVAKRTLGHRIHSHQNPEWVLQKLDAFRVRARCELCPRVRYPTPDFDVGLLWSCQ